MEFFGKSIVVFLFIVHTLFALLWTMTASLVYVRDYYGPLLEFPHSAGKEILGNCGPSTEEFEDLIVNESMSEDEAEKLARTHGLAIIESVLTKKTAESFRNYILDANHKVESAYVHNPENRFHIMPSHDEPAVQAALKEIAEHPVLRPMLDRLLGPSSSLVAFSVITNLYGAVDQNWHWDTAISHPVYPDYFVPEYTLAIPMQDTTRAMGATGICPGTHMCEWPDFDFEALEEYYNSSSPEFWEQGNFNDWLQYNLPCDLRAKASAGDVLLYNADVYHRGNGHTDPEAPERVVAFLTFAGSRQGLDDKRSLPLGTVHTLGWKMWGHTIDEFSTMQTNPWRIWHAFGLFNSKKENGARPWTLLDNILMIFKQEDEKVHIISDGFSAEYFTDLVSLLLLYVFIATGFYFIIAPFLVFLVLLSSLNPSARQIKND